ncbi:hypothetical protein ABEB36_000464 [Hypothenemus hampei]
MGSASQKSKDSVHTGIIPRALKQLFEEVDNSNIEAKISISFSEVYNEKVFDLLLKNNKSPLPVIGFTVQGLSKKHVKSVFEAIELLETGNSNRHVGETKQNLNSSRSHGIFTVYYTTKNGGKEISGELNLVDLAGSERARKTGSRGNTFQEGVNINKGLLSIGQVISALSTKSTHIPYRQSTITSILQASLNVDNYITLIACVSAKMEDASETLQTLDFAHRAKKIRCNPEIIAKYKKENPGIPLSTPLKRPSSTPFRTPAVKQHKMQLLPVINNDNSHSLKNQGSITFSTSSSSDDVQQTISPVIRKYMHQMEASLKGRFESVIKNSIRPTRSSPRNKENMSILEWSTLQNEIARIVRKEMAQFTLEKSVMVTSSPIRDDEALKARRLFNNGSPDDAEQETLGNKPLETVQDCFKVPELPVGKCKSKKILVSPTDIETVPRIDTRRSLRLSLKNTNQISDQDTSLNEFTRSLGDGDSHKYNSRRRSVRISKAVEPLSTLKRNSVKGSNDSPFTSHSKKVLTILNKGTSKDLEKLHTIGCKTADQIILFRALKSRFNKIDDLLKLPGWSQKKYDRFVNLNLLHRD